MSRRAIQVAVVVVLVLCFAGSLSAGSKKFSCNSNGRVFRVQLGTNSVFDVTMMWAKSAADNDVSLFDIDGVLIGLGIGIADRYEHVAIGGLSGFVVDVVASKVSGPNGACVLRWTNQIANLRGGREARLRDLGSLDELAASDPKYAMIKAQVEAYGSLKRPAE